MKIFVSAYACEPGLGSEIGVGWHWILEMSRFAELWVLTRESNRHSIEPWIKQHPEFSNIHFLYYDWPKWARFWKKGLRGVRTYYNLWQLSTNRIVKRTMRENGIQIFHHVTYGNVLWKVSGYGSKQTFVWGPVGGLETIPEEFTSHYSRKSRIIESVRRGVVRMLPLNHGFRKRCRRADLILCKTEITRDLIPVKYRHKAVLQTDVATEDLETLTIGAPGLQPGDMGQGINVRVGNPDPLNNPAPMPLRFITVGRLDAWRGFDLAIEAFAKIAQEKDVELIIVGKGEDRERLEQLAKQQGVSAKVRFTGKVDACEYRRLMQEADAVVNASLKEGAVTVSFDAMALGKPLICVDTTGYTRYFTEEYAVMVPLGKREEIIDGLAAGMQRVADDAERHKMGNAALAAAKRFTWHHRGEEIRERMENLSRTGNGKWKI